MLAWIKKRRGGQLEIVERLVLTPQHTLCLVRVGEKTMLIGTAPQNLQVICGAGTPACRVHTPVDTITPTTPLSCPQECLRHK